MPQGPLRASVANNPSGTGVQVAADSSKRLIVVFSETNTVSVTGATTLAKVGAGSLGAANIVAATSAGKLVQIYDCTATSIASAVNLVAQFNGTVGVNSLNHFPMAKGIVVKAGSGTHVVVSYN